MLAGSPTEGTRFAPSGERRYSSFKLWLKYAKPVRGRVVVDAGAARALREGVIVESLNPKTAAFFLAFIPHFIDPAQGQAVLQFAAFGLISVALNTLADVAVVVMASRARDSFRPKIVRRLRQTSGVVMCGLGASLALARRST